MSQDLTDEEFKRVLCDIKLPVLAKLCKESNGPNYWKYKIYRKKCDLVDACASLPRGHRTRSMLMSILDKRIERYKEKERLQDLYVRARMIHGVEVKPTVYSDNDFMNLPNEEELFECMNAYQERVGTARLAELICGSCGRRLNIKDHGVRTIPVHDIRHKEKLKPFETCPAQRLINGMLLEPESIRIDDRGITYTSLCQSCRYCLEDEGPDPPELALSNGLWIGAVPIELSSLTFPESLLIGLVYPRAFICKLWPKDRRGAVADNLQSGLRGNVTSFELNMEAVNEMVQGRLMPRPLTILPHLISITFISKRQLDKESLKHTFRVRRASVTQALHWLKINNTRYYGDIVIDENILRAFPVDDVPDIITSGILQEEDEEVLDVEHNSYVPVDPEPGCDIATKDSDVIPLSYSGQHDVDMTRITACELMMWGLNNLWRNGEESGYGILHGSQPVSTFGYNPNSCRETQETNYWERAYPCLYPYGMGGPEIRRPVPVNLKEHARWSLLYHDKHFRHHETFCFNAFSVLQRREALLSARIQMSRGDFERDMNLLQEITYERMMKAAEEEGKGKMISDYPIRMLMKHLHATSARVEGTDASRIKLRSMIWSQSYLLNPPNIWLTINPDDIDDPIVQFIAGNITDLSYFDPEKGPIKKERARTVSRDPFAAALYFNVIVNAVIECLMGIRNEHGKLIMKKGIFGFVSGFFGVVETQGRGALHLHTIIWLCGSPSGGEMIDLLKTEDFRSRLKHFIARNIRASSPSTASEESVRSTAPTPSVAWSVTPRAEPTETYRRSMTELEDRVARSKQIHSCNSVTCLFLDRYARSTCRRNFPKPLTPEDYVRSDGEWGAKRMYGYVNNWNPTLGVLLKCNHDIKILTNGSESAKLTFYCTCYAAKKQKKSHNVSALIAKHYAFNQQDDVDSVGAKDATRLMLVRCMEAIRREQELSAPLVMSYLMGWKDVFLSHRFEPVYWSGFVSTLFDSFPELKPLKNEPRVGVVGNIPNITSDKEVETDQQNITLMWSHGKLSECRNQVEDYEFRGDSLEACNIVEMFRNTYEEYITTGEKPAKSSDTISSSENRGRQRHARHFYQPEHPRSTKKYRISRAQGHNTLPNFIGVSFPREDDENVSDYFFASMLLLLKPWRNVKDLKGGFGSWKEAYEEFVDTTTRGNLQIISNIQHFHRCKDSASRSREAEDENELESQKYLISDDAEVDEMDILPPTQLHVPTETEWKLLRNEQELKGDVRLYVEEAILLAESGGIFKDTEFKRHGVVTIATDQDIIDFNNWIRILNEKKDADGYDEKIFVDRKEVRNGEVISLEDLRSAEEGPSCCAKDTVDEIIPALEGLKVEHLNEEQLRAYEIVKWCLDKNLAGEDIPQMLLLLHGEGGTGKSRVIQTITELYERKGLSNLLIKVAPTGVAASLIGGETIHKAIRISPNSMYKETSDIAKRELEVKWGNKQLLIIDEDSMISREFFALMSAKITLGRMDDPKYWRPFGNLNVLMCGDFHQFPPIAAKSIYFTDEKEKVDIQRKLRGREGMGSGEGRAFFEEFRSCVLLKRQMRVRDNEWLSFLRNLRIGAVTSEDLQMLRETVVNPSIVETDPAWMKAKLITPRHSVRNAWNERALKQHSSLTGNQIYVWNASNTHGNQELDDVTFYHFQKWKGDSSKRSKKRKQMLPDSIQLSVGADVMVTTNIDTDIDLANGTRGVVEKIVLDPRESQVGKGQFVHLKYLPSFILVRLERTRAVKLPGLEENVLPIAPIILKYSVPLRVGDVEMRKSISVKQFPISLGYAFTDYRAQGQTLERVIIDIAEPKTGGALTLFNVYVALSRGRGRDSIRLLRGFSETLFTKQLPTCLLEQDTRLEEMDERTRVWWEQVKRNEIM